jgi:tetratricopeptide (TPR) repeat protein
MSYAKDFHIKFNFFFFSTNKSSPIWWYTRDTFLYAMLNRALRTQDIEIIIKMGFFVRDLHEHIKNLHLNFNKEKHLTVYRGQGILPEDIQRLEKNKGGLLSFSNFLSTTLDKNISWTFVQRALENLEQVAIHFLMKINPKISSTPFASLDHESFFNDYEQEILFSMHTVFRIDDIKQINERLWEVYLTLTSDYEQQLTKLTDFFRNELKGQTGWHRLASLLTKMGEYEKSLQIYDTLLQQINDENNWEDLSYLHHQLGYNYKQKGDLSRALIHYQTSLDIELKYYSSNDPHLTPTYSNIGEIYRLEHDLIRALEYFQRALDIEQKSQKSDQLKIASYYNNIGMVFNEQGRHTKALENYENTLKIKLKELPSYHPSLAITYNNIGGVHFSLGDFSNAYLYFQKALEVEEKVLPSTHNSLAITHTHMAIVLTHLDQNEDALKHAKQALDIARYTYQPDDKQFKIYQDHVNKITEKL